MSSFAHREGNILAAIGTHPLQSKRLAYGTAGFRDNNTILPSTCTRMGILACLRSLAVGSGKFVGVMITASHNPEQDNGLKIVDTDGGMLTQSWEPFAEDLANSTVDTFMSKLNHMIAAKEISPLPTGGAAGLVLIGRDTRPHSAALADCVKAGIVAMGGIYHDLGEVITPQLHWVVQRVNARAPESRSADLDCASLLSLYYSNLLSSYTQLEATCICSSFTSSSSKPACSEIVIDASAGVGSVVLDKFQKAAADSFPDFKLQLDVRNKLGDGLVNDGCGAELVQKSQVYPRSIDATTDSGKILCSFDGDGDRIVFHAFLEGRWILLDGDKIAVLISTFLGRELVAAKLDDKISFGVVQTAYANGASSKFLRSQGISVHMAKTGVKYVHHKALEFDVGVYFEANGHGTVIFSDNFNAKLAEATTDAAKEQKCSDAAADAPRIRLALTRLNLFLSLINQSVGDALSDMLCCLISLQLLGLDIKEWHEMYADLPSKQMKVSVRDKSTVKCSEDETHLLSPPELQADLQAAMDNVSEGRCFVRPSGTEDVVRIYAEASTAAEAEKLASDAQKAIEKHLA